MNIGFKNCASVYFHHKLIKEFLTEWPDKNKLLRSIDFDCREKVFLAGCR
jgi:hypothetical protein